MTNEELLSVAEIVERLVARFHAQADDHEAKMVEHRASFGARTKADAETIDRLQKERDALRAEVAALQERLRASIARGDFAQMELAALKSQTPKHPGEPCDPPATHDTPEGLSVAESVIRNDRNTEPKPGDTVRLVRVPTPGPDFDGLIDFPWNTDWGAVGDVAAVVATLAPTDLPVAAVRVSSGIVVWWPLSCVEVVRTEPDEIKVGDLVEVFQRTRPRVSKKAASATPLAFREVLLNIARSVRLDTT